MLISPKKIYTIDAGFAQANSLSFSKDKGRLLENIVFIQLRRLYKNVYFFKEKHECDFLVKVKNDITQAIQVCYDLNTDNLNREINGLIEALEFFKLKTGTIITLNQKDDFSQKGFSIKVIPAHEWLDK
jgi:predicted AAA+ superfamily ATPase